MYTAVGGGDYLSAVTLMNGGFFVHRDLSLDTTIFRCVKAKRVYELFENKRLYFNSATAWEDTWEIPSHFFKLKDNSGPTYVIDDANRVASDLYGTCWTTQIDSDAIWRIYSGKEKDGIFIQTTVRKLFQSIDFSFLKSFVDGFIGPVRYEQLNTAQGGETFFDSESECYPRNMVPAFIKRKAFEHEHEIRFLIHAPEHKKIYPHNPLSITENKSGMYLPFKDCDFVEQLIVDPRLSENEFEAIQKNFACYEKNIIKSTLYDTPEKIYEIILNSGCPGHKVLQGAKWWTGSDFRYLNND